MTSPTIDPEDYNKQDAERDKMLGLCREMLAYLKARYGVEPRPFTPERCSWKDIP